MNDGGGGTPKRWSEEETLLALYLYFQLPFGKRSEDLSASFDARCPKRFRPRHQSCPVLPELSVCGTIELRRALQALASGLSDLGIETRKVAQLHRDRAVGSTEGCRELLNLRIARMERRQATSNRGAKTVRTGIIPPTACCSRPRSTELSTAA